MNYIDEEIEAEAEDDFDLKNIVQICAPLALSSSITQNALDTYRRYNSGLLSTDAQEWFCCAVYSELQQAKMKDMRSKQQVDNAERLDVDTASNATQRGNSWNLSLTRLLSCFKMNMTKFLKRMEHWNWLTQQGQTFQQEIEELQRRISITIIIQQHYKRIFEQLYVLPKDDGQEGEDGRSHYQSLYEFGWILFLVLRNELPNFVTQNLVNGCQLLICVIELIYVNALEVSGSPVIKKNFSGLPNGWSSPNFDGRKLNNFSALPAIMALMPELPEKGIRIMQRAFFHKSLMVLFMDQRLLGNDNIFRELIKDGILEVNVSVLNRSYAHHISDISEMDERVILSRNLGHDASKSNSEPRISNNLSQLLNKQLPRSIPSLIVDALNKNSGNLLTSLKSSIQNMGSQFITKAKHCLSKQEAESRFSLASGLYYKLLQTILVSELQMKPLMKISQLLEQPTFSCNLMACCLDLALYVYDEEMDKLKFPFVLDCYPTVDPYDYQKIPELVVRHHYNLFNRQLVKHLHLVEEKCLESLIFRETSRFWKCFKKSEKNGNRYNSLPSYEEVQQREGCREKENQPISSNQGSVICLRKFYSLAQQRLSHLCQALYLMDSYLLIWHLVEYSITLHGGKLIQQRHLDHLLLCAIHLHDRLTKERLSFSDIIQQYRRQSFAKSSVYRQVALSEGRTGDIILFYNQIYVKSVANHARRLLENRVTIGQQNALMKTTLGHRSPLQEFAKPIVKQMYSNIFVTPPALDRECLYNSLIKIAAESTVTEDPVREKEACSTDCVLSPPIETISNLKRASSEKQLVAVFKRPNILRRRTCYE